MARSLSILLAFVLVLSALTETRPADDEEIVIRDRKLSEWLTMLEKEKKVNRRYAALLVLEIVGTKSKEVLPAVRRALLEDPEPELRIKAADLLHTLVDEKQDPKSQYAVTALSTALREDKDGSVRRAAAKALGRLAPASVPAVAVLTVALKDSDAGVRAEAAETLGRLEDKAEPALENLMALLKDHERLPRMYACYALGRIGSGGKSAVALIGELLRGDPDADVRKEAARALAAFKDDALPALPALTKALSDDKTEVRQAAALALSKLGGDIHSALPQLKIALKDRDKSVRFHAVNAIGSMGKGAREAVKELGERLRLDEILEVRLAVIAVLEQLGADARPAEKDLELALKDPRKSVRDAAEEALKKIR